MTCMPDFSHDSVPSIPFPTVVPSDPTVKLPLGRLLPLLLDAVLAERAWVDDFADDEVSISADLHEVLRLYAHRRRSA